MNLDRRVSHIWMDIKPELKFLGLAGLTYLFGGFLYVEWWRFGTQKEFIQGIAINLPSLSITLMVLRWWWGQQHDDRSVEQKLDTLTKEVQSLKMLVSKSNDDQDKPSGAST